MLEKPPSLGSLRIRGIWPPSNPGATLLRALVPLVPRPAVLPFDASPRPTRVRAVRDPGAGRRWCSFSPRPSWTAAPSAAPALLSFLALAFLVLALLVLALLVLGALVLASAMFSPPPRR